MAASWQDWQERAKTSPSPKIASLPIAVVAIAVVQVGAAFLAIAVQQSTGARLDGFLDGLVVLTLLWTIVALVDLFAFPDQSMTRTVAGPAFAVAVVAVGLFVIFRAVEGVMGHSLGVRYAFGQIGYSTALVWAAASLGFLLVEWFAARPKAPETTEAEAEPEAEELPIDQETNPAPTPRKTSAFSAALEAED